MIVGASKLRILLEGELRTHEVPSDEKAVGEDLQQVGWAGQGRLLLILGQHLLPFNFTSLPVITIES